MIARLRQRQEWQFFGVLPKADGPLALTWWSLVVLRGILLREHAAEQHHAAAIGVAQVDIDAVRRAVHERDARDELRRRDRGGRELDQPNREQRGDDDERDEGSPAAYRCRAGGEFGLGELCRWRLALELNVALFGDRSLLYRDHLPLHL